MKLSLRDSETAVGRVFYDETVGLAVLSGLLVSVRTGVRLRSVGRLSREDPSGGRSRADLEGSSSAVGDFLSARILGTAWGFGLSRTRS